jgi:hypothetical protein
MRLGIVGFGFAALGIAACSGATAPVVEGPGPDPTRPDPAPSPTSPFQPAATAPATYAKSCAQAALPGRLDSALLAFRLDYPSTWNNLTKQQDQPKLANYSTVAAPKLEERGDLYVSRYYLGDPSIDPATYLRDQARRGSEWREHTLGGHPAVSYWERVTPAAPGCEGCNGDPGPDIIQIHLVVGMGGREILDVVGSARVTAAQQVFCDIQAIEASFAASK